MQKHSLRTYMQEHLKTSFLLAGYGFAVHLSAPPGILEIARDGKENCVTTTGIERGRNRRYFVMPVADQPSGWRITRVEVNCAVCKGRGIIHSDAPCHYCSGTGWVPLDETANVPQFSPSHARC